MKVQLSERQVDGTYEEIGVPMDCRPGDAIGIMNDHFMLPFSEEGERVGWNVTKEEGSK